MRGSADLHTCMTTVETKLQISKCSATLISPTRIEMESLLKQHTRSLHASSQEEEEKKMRLRPEGAPCWQHAQAGRVS